MSNESPKTLKEACWDLRNVYYDAFINPLLPPLTKLVVWLTRRIEAGSRWLDRMTAT